MTSDAMALVDAQLRRAKGETEDQRRALPAMVTKTRNAPLVYDGRYGRRGCVMYDGFVPLVQLTDWRLFSVKGDDEEDPIVVLGRAFMVAHGFRGIQPDESLVTLDLIEHGVLIRSGFFMASMRFEPKQVQGVGSIYVGGYFEGCFTRVDDPNKHLEKL